MVPGSMHSFWVGLLVTLLQPPGNLLNFLTSSSSSSCPAVLALGISMQHGAQVGRL